MAELKPTLEYKFGGQPNCLRVTWAALGSGDTGEPVTIGEYPDRTYQVYGNFGSGASVTLEGSNDLAEETPIYVVLTNPQGAAIQSAAAAMAACEEAPLIVRPKVVGGDANTNLNVRLLCRRPRT